MFQQQIAITHRRRRAFPTPPLAPNFLLLKRHRGGLPPAERVWPAVALLPGGEGTRTIGAARGAAPSCGPPASSGRCCMLGAAALPPMSLGMGSAAGGGGPLLLPPPQLPALPMYCCW